MLMQKERKRKQRDKIRVKNKVLNGTKKSAK